MTDHFTHSLPVAAADPATLRDLVQLDPCRAWRADLAEAGLAEPLPEELAARWLLWLQIGTVFDRLRMLPVDERAAYARSTAGLWESAERVTGLSRFARVGEVMAAWCGEAPELDGFRELLWAVEQAEADGASKNAYCALQALSLTVDHRDIRGAYATAQSGRVLRTLGHLEEALTTFEVVARSAQLGGDRWLLARVRLGAGVVYHTRGNFPAARSAFRKALRFAAPYVDLLIGAHLGIVSTSCTRENFRSARRHAMTALGLADGDAHAEVEVLSLLAELHVQAQRYQDAQAFCARALEKEPRAHKVPCLLRNMVYASLCLNDDQTARAHFDRLCHSISVTPNPWEHASCEYMIGYAYSRWGSYSEADEHFSRACEMADQYALHEIHWRAERALRENQVSARTHRDDGDIELREGGNSWMRSESHTNLGSFADSALRP